MMTLYLILIRLNRQSLIKLKQLFYLFVFPMSLEGSKPRRWIKNVNYNNPTMHSHNLISIFNPQISRVYDSPAKYYQKRKDQQIHPQRSWVRNQTPQKDSLDKSIQKNQKIQYQRTQQTPRQKDQRERIAKIWLSKSVVQPNNKTFNNPTTKEYLNFQNTKSIRNKQLHGYNIISNL